MIKFEKNLEIKEKIDDIDDYFHNVSLWYKTPRFLKISCQFFVANDRQELFSNFRTGGLYQETLEAFSAPKTHFGYNQYRFYNCHTLCYIHGIEKYWFLIAYNIEAGMEIFLYDPIKNKRNTLQKKWHADTTEIIYSFLKDLYQKALNYALTKPDSSNSLKIFFKNNKSLTHYLKNNNFNTLMPK